MKKKKIITNLIASFIVICCFGIVVFAENLNNDVKVQPNSDLTYYLNVDYDGVDENAIVSSDSVTASVRSDIIEVEDKLPEGLTFKGIVETENGQIGAFKRDDGSACSGYVVDGIDGITYNSDKHTVSFKVKNLGAGCRITVGIITTVPDVDDPDTSIVEARRDFYNTFSAVEDSLSVISNQVHVFIGDENATLYKVEYEYTGSVPDKAPEVPTHTEYASGTTVGVAQDINVTGYEFSGWETTDVTVSNGTFEMPNKNVKFTGSFTQKESYEVVYQIDGDYPESYFLPETEEYYENNNVNLNILEEGDIVDGYRFLGWQSSDVDISSGTFQMPANNVTITGKFKRISYKVSYAFEGSTIPDNSDSLLPETQEYYPGDKVKLEQPGTSAGYKFLGLYKKDNFIMPADDVIIYGEWMRSNGTFEPTIKKEIINKKDVYILGDIVKFKITVTNTADYDIKDVMVIENNEGAKFTSGEGYEISTDHIVSIPKIESNNKVILYSEYEVTEDSLPIERNEVEILGALADNNYQLDTDKKYKAVVEFNTSQDEKNEIVKETNNPITIDDIFKYIIIFVISVVILTIIIFFIKRINNKTKSK